MPLGKGIAEVFGGIPTASKVWDAATWKVTSFLSPSPRRVLATADPARLVAQQTLTRRIWFPRHRRPGASGLDRYRHVRRVTAAPAPPDAPSQRRRGGP